MKCSACGNKISEDRDTCSTCGAYAGPPNVREVCLVSEKEALERRFNKAIVDAHADGHGAKLDEFSQTIKDSRAVVAIDLGFLAGFMTRDEVLYSSYGLAVAGENRKAADGKNDKKRRGIEGFFFGSYAKSIRYAALSLDGKGLSSYGPFTLVLKDIAVMARATVLEENSYNFFDKHKAHIPDNFPPGYRALWGERYKLAVAKLKDRIVTTTSNNEFPAILLSCSGNRATDNFMEVHIYGTFDKAAVEAVVGSSKTASKADKAQLSVVIEKLKIMGVEWIES